MAVIERRPCEAAREHYDLIIVGGGIYGATLSLEASRRGLRSLLVERGDFGGATSFNSHRIIHGGLRYLQECDWPRTLESVRARRWFLRFFPELVFPLPCLMPLYGRGLRWPAVFRAALRLNDLLSHRRNAGVRRDRFLPPGEVIDAAETARRFPSVNRAGLRGGAVWYDACLPDSQRLLIEILRWSCSLGGTALNYVEATGLLHASGSVLAIRAVDRETEEVFEFRAPLVLNATGPWSRRTATCFDRDHEALFRSSLAWCILFDRDPPSEYALAVTPKRPGAQTYFLVPWKGKLLAGTGHAPWQEDPDDARPDAEQLGRFLQEINAAAAGLKLREEEIRWVFAGLLPAEDAARTRPAVRDVFIDHSQRGGPRGLYSLSGVKLTTAPRVAARTLDRVCGPHRAGDAEGAPAARPALQHGWDVRASELLGNPESGWQGALRRIIEEEAALHLDDLVLRRTTLWEDPSSALALAPRLAALFLWDDERCREEIDRLACRLSRGAGGVVSSGPAAGTPTNEWQA